MLEERHRTYEAEFAGREVPRPPQWGGIRVVPENLELWQGRPDRLHDRLRYAAQRRCRRMACGAALPLDVEL